jgi:hypothetical protein
VEEGTTPVRLLTTWVIAICNPLLDIRRWRKEDLHNSGKTNPASEVGQTEACQQTSLALHNRTANKEIIRPWLCKEISVVLPTSAGK